MNIFLNFGTTCCVVNCDKMVKIEDIKLYICKRFGCKLNDFWLCKSGKVLLDNFSLLEIKFCQSCLSLFEIFLFNYI